MMTSSNDPAFRAEFGFINGPSVTVRARQSHEAEVLSKFVEGVRSQGGVRIDEIAKVVATDLEKEFDFEFSNELYWLRHYASSRYVDGLAPCSVTSIPVGEYLTAASA